MEPEGSGDGGRQIFSVYTIYILKYDTNLPWNCVSTISRNRITAKDYMAHFSPVSSSVQYETTPTSALSEFFLFAYLFNVLNHILHSFRPTLMPHCCSIQFSNKFAVQLNVFFTVTQFLILIYHYLIFLPGFSPFKFFSSLLRILSCVWPINIYYILKVNLLVQFNIFLCVRSLFT
jgi:hypothetical protein